MEDELKLFQKFLKTQHSLMLLRHNPNDEVENELNETLEETKNNLENFGNNDLSLKAKYAIYDQIQAYID
jgi:Uri superfamily endonuclease